MLAGCSSSTLLSPRHRLRIEASKQFQACQYQLPNSMSTQRLDMQCSFPRREVGLSSPTIRPVGVSVDQKPIESRTASCSLRQQNIRLPPLATRPQLSLRGRRETEGGFWEQGSNLKRFAERSPVDAPKKLKKKRGTSKDVVQSGDDAVESNDGSGLRLGQYEGESCLFQPGFEVSSYLPSLSQPEAQFSGTVSEDGDRVCYVPSQVISPPPVPLSNNPWIDSVVTVITHLGDKEIETSHRLVREEPSESRTSSEISLSLGLNENPQVHEAGNGSGNPRPVEGAAAQVVDEDSQEEHRGFELVSLLVACVDALGSRNIVAINHFIAKLGDLASPRGRTPISRLVTYFAEGLAIRSSRILPHVFHIATPRDLDRVDDELGTSFRLLNQISPIPRFIHFSSNEILLRAFEGKEKVHIVDFDIKQGLQWPSFFQSLASRSSPPVHVRITGVGESKHELNETGDRLAGFAGAMNLPFEFHPVVDRLEDVRLWMLHLKEGESVAANCIFQLHKTLYESNGGALRDLLGLIRSTNPTVVVMAEQEAATNVLSLDTRVCNSLKYYSAIFDSLNASLPSPTAPARIKTEQLFAREIRNIIACEGSERQERHEVFSTWKKLMTDGGFRSLPIKERELLQSQMLLKMYSFDNFSVKTQGEDEDGSSALTLSWEDEPLYTVSAWTPVDPAAGTPSSFSQPS